MCHWIAQNGGGVRRWRPEASTCGPDMTYSGAKSRSSPQMFLNKGQIEKIKQRLPVREACGRTSFICLDGRSPVASGE